MNILERIDGYGIWGKLANAAITIAGVATLVGYLIVEYEYIKLNQDLI